MKDNDNHRYSSDDFGAVEAPFLPSPSVDPAERMAHAMEYIASALSLLVDQPEFPPAHEAQADNHKHDHHLQASGDHQVIRLEATDRHWPTH